jgi:hypothetical protein
MSSGLLDVFIIAVELLNEQEIQAVRSFSRDGRFFRMTEWREIASAANAASQ